MRKSIKGFRGCPGIGLGGGASLGMSENSMMTCMGEGVVVGCFSKFFFISFFSSLFI